MIRPATPADLPALLALEELCFTGDRLSRRAFSHHIRNPQASLLVMQTREGELAGYVLILHPRRHHLARIYSLAVHPARRGAGAGRALLAAAEAACGKPGCRLELRPDNTAARHLYQSCGYRLFRRREHFYEDGAPALEMRHVFTTSGPST